MTSNISHQPVSCFALHCYHSIFTGCIIICTFWDRKTNHEILSQYRMESIETLLKFRRLRWLGHMARMGGDCLPKQLLGNVLCSAAIGPGRPQKRWREYAREDLAELNMAYDWYRVVQNHEIWRSRIQKLLMHT